MEDRGVTRDILYDLYITQNKKQSEILKMFNISEGVLRRWLKECEIPLKHGRMYTFDINFFDHIDTEQKAYWLGFIWCDGYVLERFRDGRVRERPVKISLAEQDIEHLNKLKENISSNHPVHLYDTKGFGKISKEARITLNNLHFGNVLREKYGMIPHRTDASKVLGSIPSHLSQHFLRGVFDADGSITNYYLQSGKNVGQLKSTVTFSTYTQLTDWIQELLIKEGIKDNRIRLYKRHGDGSDGDCVILTYTGVQQVTRIMEYMYKDATVYLSRKKEKYDELLSMVEDREGNKYVSVARQ